MARIARCEVFRPEEEAIVHVSNRCVRGLYLMGRDQTSGQDYSYRRSWFRLQLQLCAAYFAIDLLEHAIMENHFHLLLRSRPDIVQCWNNREVARRWLMLCPKKRNKDGSPVEPTAAQVRALTQDPQKLKQLRRRLSDISWFVRKVCQYVAQRANREEKDNFGKFWDGRFHAVRLLDEEAVLACSAYINLNPVRAIMAYTIEQQSQYTSAEMRIQDLVAYAQAIQANQGLLDDTLPTDAAWQPPPDAESLGVHGASPLQPQLYRSRLSQEPRQPELELPPKSGRLADALTEQFDQWLEANWHQQIQAEDAQDPEDPESPELAEQRRAEPEPYRRNAYLAPLEIDEALDPLGPRLSRSRQRASDKGYLPMPLARYIELLEWCARQIRPDKRGFTPAETPPVVKRLGIPPEVWLQLVTNFGELFSVVAGMPEKVDSHRGLTCQRFPLPETTRLLLSFRPSASAPEQDRHTAPLQSP